MGFKVPALAAGEEFIAGRSRDKATELVELAEAAGLKGTVRTTYNGYIVPSAIFASDAKDVDPEVLAQLEAEKAAAQAQADAESTPEDVTDVVPDPETDAAVAEVEDTPEDEPAAVEFDPSAATVDEVKEYLDGADDTERERVLAAEAEGKGRKGVLELATIPEGAK